MKNNLKKEILDLAKRMIRIESIPAKPKALHQIVESVKAELKDFTIEEFEKDGVPSILVFNRKTRPKSFKIILNGHLDVIPGKTEFYKPKIVGDRLYGVGAMDMKANVACLISVFREIATQVDYPLALQLVTDEQTGSLCGTKYQIDHGVRSEFVLVGETTNFKIINAAKGVFWLKISIEGKSAHSAYPWEGDNAIQKMQELLEKIKVTFPTPNREVWQSTVSLSEIKTNSHAFNRIPDYCEIWLDVRYIAADKDSILKKIEEMIPVDFNTEITFSEPALAVMSANTYLDKLKTVAETILAKPVNFAHTHGTADTTYYARINCPAVEFGPRGLTGNTTDEYIEIESLLEYRKILVDFLLQSLEVV